MRAPQVLCPNAWRPGRVGGITMCSHESHPRYPKNIWWEIHCIGRKENKSSTMILPDLPANGRADVGSDEPKSPGWGAILVSLTQSPKVSTFPHFLISGSLPVSSFNPDGIVFQVRGWQCTGTTCKWRLSICLEFWNAVIPANEWSVIFFWWTVHFGVIVRAYLCFNWAKTDNWNDYVCSRDQLIFHWTWSTCLTQIEVSRWESFRNVCEAIWWSNLDRWTLPLKG